MFFHESFLLAHTAVKLKSRESVRAGERDGEKYGKLSRSCRFLNSDFPGGSPGAGNFLLRGQKKVTKEERSGLGDRAAMGAGRSAEWLHSGAKKTDFPSIPPLTSLI